MELKRRISDASLLLNEAFLHPPVSALISEISIEWITRKKIYLNINPILSPLPYPNLQKELYATHF